MKIAIITTAINRPDLHSITLKNLLSSQFLNDIDIDWYINIDVITKLNASFEETSNQIKKLIMNFSGEKNKKISRVIFSRQQNPDFRNACNITLNAAIKNEYDYFFWLEDDWILNDENITLLDIINNTQIKNWDTLSLCNRNLRDACNFNPTLISPKIALELAKALDKTHTGDPENIYIQSCSSLITNHITYKNCFDDVGRDWIKNFKITKWRKSDIGNKPVTYI